VILITPADFLAHFVSDFVAMETGRLWYTFTGIVR